MNVLYLSGREPSYARNDVLLRALRRLATVNVVGENNSNSILRRSLSGFFQALPRLLSGQHDLIIIGFYGHLLTLLIRTVSRLPILFDAFISTYDTLCFDRQLFSPESLRGRLTFWLDRTACSLASLVLVDTPQQADYFVRTFAVPQQKIFPVPVGCNEDIFFPRAGATRNHATTVLYYSSYQPLHGVDTVVRAAELVRKESDIHFRLVGAGPTFLQVRELANELGLDNISFPRAVPLKDLANEIANADICLGGPFGKTGKAARVIPGKIYQILAMQRPLIAASTPANTALLSHEKNAYLCEPDSPDVLAAAILRLQHDSTLRDKIAVAGRATFLERCSEAVITEQLKAVINTITR